MKLSTGRIREFKSIWDSNTFEVGRVDCLVGKNESGKTAILQALYRLNPIIDNQGEFDVTDDYPRSEVEDYQQDIESGRRKHAIIVEATFELETVELTSIRDEYGDGVLETPQVIVSKGYAKNSSGKCALDVNVPFSEPAFVKNLVKNFELPESIAAEAVKNSTLAQLVNYLDLTATKQAEELASAQTVANLLPDAGEKAAALEESKTRDMIKSCGRDRKRTFLFGKVLSPNETTAKENVRATDYHRDSDRGNARDTWRVGKNCA